MLKNLKMFIPLTKIDEEKRLVYGVATAEKKDRSGEICHYEKTKPLYQKWSDDIKNATNGKSLGNIRAMHGKVAAGKVQDIVFNDEGKQIEICAKVVDDNEWKKVMEGVYTGFSQGGSYAEKWDDPKDKAIKWYAASPSEISLVDLPCLPESTFTAIKADGATELRKFTSVIVMPSHTEVGMKAEAMAKAYNETKPELSKSWKDFTDEAQAALIQEQVDKAAAKEEEDPPAKEQTAEEKKTAEEAAAKEKSKKDKSKKYVEPKQLWRCNHADHEHLQKADAVGCMKNDQALEKAAEVAAPVEDALSKLEKLVSDAPAEMPRAEVVEFIKAWKPETEVTEPFTAGLVKLIADPKDTLGAALAKVEFKPGTDGKVILPQLQKVVAGFVEKRDFTEDERKQFIKDGISLKDGSHPIPDKDALKAEIAIFKKGAVLKRHIVKRAKALGADLPKEWKDAKKVAADTPELMKAATFDTVSSLLSLLGSAERLEEGLEGDGGEMYYYNATNTRVSVPKDICDRMGALLVELADISAGVLDEVISAMADEEREEAMERGALLGDLAKAGARHSKADLNRVQKMHDLSCELGAGCGDDDEAASKGAGGDLAKVNKALEKSLGDVVPRLEALTKQVEEMSKRAAPAKGSLRVVEKGKEIEANATTEEVSKLAEALDKMTPEARAEELMKLALRNPSTFIAERK